MILSGGPVHKTIHMGSLSTVGVFDKGVINILGLNVCAGLTYYLLLLQGTMCCANLAVCIRSILIRPHSDPARVFPAMKAPFATKTSLGHQCVSSHAWANSPCGWGWVWYWPSGLKTFHTFRDNQNTKRKTSTSEIHCCAEYAICIFQKEVRRAWRQIMKKRA